MNNLYNAYLAPPRTDEYYGRDNFWDGDLWEGSSRHPDFIAGAKERANADLLSILGEDYGPTAPVDYTPQTPVGSMGLLGIPQSGSNYSNTGNMLGGNFHNAMKQAMTGNTGRLQGLLSTGSAQRPGRLKYTHSGE